MRHPFSTFAVFASSLLLLQSCWPGAPIVAGIVASDGSSSSRTTLAGAIIVGGTTEFTSLGHEHEPNDNGGFAQPLGAWGATGPAAITGNAERSLRILTLPDPVFGARHLREDDLLARHRSGLHRIRGGGSPFAPDFVAWGEDGVWLAESGTEIRVRHQVSPQGLARSDFRWTLDGELVGFTQAWGQLFALHGDGQRQLSIFDAFDGSAITTIDLPSSSAIHLAGATASTGDRPVLYTLDPFEHIVYEIPFRFSGSDLIVDPLRPIADLAGFGRVGGLASTGDLLLAARAVDGALGVFDPADGFRITTVHPLGGESVSALAAHLSHGSDCFQVAIQPGQTLDVTLETDPSATMILAAADREAALLGETDQLHGSTTTISGRSGTLRLAHPGGSTPWKVDLVIRAISGGGGYALLAGEGGQVPLTSDHQPRTDAGYVAIREALDRAAASESTARLWGRYTDWELPPHDADLVAMAFEDDASAQATPDRTGSFDLTEVRRTPNCRVAQIEARPSFRVEPPIEIDGVAVPSTVRREESRQLQCCLLELEGHSGLRWCEPQLRLFALAETPNDTHWEAQTWQHAAVQLPDAWDITTGSTDVIVAIVDSGIRTESSDLGANAIDGYDFVSTVGDAGDGDGIDSDPYDEGDFISHGTHVGGSAGARGNNGFGVAGAMWFASIMPIRALGTDGSGSTIDIAEAIRYAAGLSNDSGTLPEEAAHVINLSLGSSTLSNAMQDAVLAADDEGITVLAAVGNDGISGVLFPAAHDTTIAIAATDFLDERATYSNTGPEVDLAVPGGDEGGQGNPDNDLDDDGNIDQILSTVGSANGVDEGLFAFLIGTSMACGNAAGYVGLLLSVTPELTPSEVLATLQSTALDIGDPGTDEQTGAGLAQVADALNSAAPVLSVSTTTVDFGQNGSSLVVQYDNIGGGTLDVRSITIDNIIGTNANWLSYEQLSDSRTIALTASRTGLADGAYQARLRISTNGGTIDVAVNMTRAAGAELPDVGTVLVQLVRSDGLIVQERQTTVGNSYRFQFEGFVNQEYFVRAGIDADSDGVICEAGESCGAYPSRNTQTLLDLSNLKTIELDILLEDD